MDPRYYYAALGLSPGASEDEIGKAYRKFARKYHPDLNSAQSAVKRFQELNEAYWVLSDPGRRRDYDQARMNAITDQESLETRFSREFQVNSGVSELPIPAGRRGRRRGTYPAAELKMPDWLRALWSPKVVAPCLIALAIACQAAWGLVPFLPGAWTGVSGTLAPIASTFEAVTVVNSGAPQAAPTVVHIKPDGTFRALLAPGSYTVWVTDTSCAGTPLAGGFSLSLGSGQHIDVGQPPSLSCPAAK